MNELQLFANGTELPKEREASWILLGKGKAKLDAQLTSQELNMQGVLLGALPLAEKLATYKKQYADLVDFRKSYTKLLDLAKDQCMVVEKRCDPKTNAEFLKVEAAELEERKVAAENDRKARAIAEERAALKAYLTNAYAQQAYDYRYELTSIVNKAYENALRSKKPVDSVDTEVKLTIEQLRSVMIQPIPKFNLQLLSKEDAKIVHDSVDRTPINSVLADAKSLLDEKFSMYANDFANAEAIIEQERIQNAAAAQLASQALEQQKAITTLTTNADVYVEATTKGVKESTSIKIEDDSQKWVLTIISAFAANFQQAFPKIKNKKYSSLTVAQMAAALDNAGIEVKGVQYETTQK